MTETMKNTLLLSALVALLLSCSQAQEQVRIPSKEAVPVRVMALTPTEISQIISASGTFSTQDEALLSFKVGGIISKLYVSEGEKIKKGQLLATIDPTEIKAGYNQAVLAKEKALRDFNRIKNLFQDSVATLEQLQNAETAYSLAQEKLDAAAFNLSRSEIRSTKNGLVLKKFVEEGQQVSSGSPVFQINGADEESWILRTTISEREWRLLQLGDRAQIHLENHPDTLLAELVQLAPAADSATGSFWADLKISKKPVGKLVSGLFARAEIFPSHLIKGWEIPYEALLDAQGEQAFVFVTPDQKTAKKIAIRIGAVQPETVQVLSGLENQTHLIVGGSAYLRDGSPINIEKP